MSLRPRYSLLTLLVLTALVAGGVKLWYGPHRVTLDSTAEPFAHERIYEFIQVLQLNNRDVRPSDELSYDYRRRLGGESEILGLTYTFKRPVYLITGRHGSDQRQGQFALRSKEPPTAAEIQAAVAQVLNTLEFRVEKIEKLLFWVCDFFPPNSGMTGIASPDNQHAESVTLLQMPVVYYVTDAGVVYRIRDTQMQQQFVFDAPLRTIRLSKVEPAKLQQRLQDEMSHYQLNPQ